MNSGGILKVLEKKNKYLVFVGFTEFLNFLKFRVSPQMGCKNLLRASQTIDGQHLEAGECVAFSFCNEKYLADTLQLSVLFQV